MTQEIRDRSGRCIGRIQELNSNQTNFMDHTGRVVARYQNGKTYDAGGKFIGNGNQGMRMIPSR